MIPDKERPEPALWIGLIGSILTTLVSLHLFGITPGIAAAILALITAAVTAVFTKPIAPALYTGVIAAGVALVAQFGFNVPDSVTTALSGLTLAVFALFGIRPQVFPTNARNEVK